MSSNDSHLDSHLTPEDARAALDRAAGIKVTSDRDIRVLTRVAVGLGITMGLVLVREDASIDAAGLRRWAWLCLLLYPAQVVLMLLISWWPSSPAPGWPHWSCWSSW